ncbi:MAG: tetratricopeptide repeat protein [Lewinellaceae bacterium]|nr:tetratricopeptide repeat protein [Saprospiraceae bacterium]MCB9341521.1 tetratricopeptide repeat protein [Lewinellaceae bacterium]
MKAVSILLLIAFLFSACQSGPDREKMQAGIQELEKQIGDDPKAQTALFTQLMGQYEDFAKAFPGDKQSAHYLSKAAELARLNQQFDKAITIYETIMKSYPDAPEASKAMFMKGFTLDNDLKNTAAAKAVYEEFLQKYPNDDFADDTAFLLKNLGKSEEEIIKEFEAGK